MAEKWRQKNDFYWATWVCALASQELRSPPFQLRGDPFYENRGTVKVNNQIRRNALWLRLGLVLVMLEIGINLACIPALGAAETNDLIAQLKAAQEHPAIVKKLVFRERGVPNQPGFDRDGFQTFFAKWQSNEERDLMGATVYFPSKKLWSSVSQ